MNQLNKEQEEGRALNETMHEALAPKPWAALRAPIVSIVNRQSGDLPRAASSRKAPETLEGQLVSPDRMLGLHGHSFPTVVSGRPFCYHSPSFGI